MTIKELEDGLGMTRANIRFYEQEGFICPERGKNNYRNYSAADAETLRKIKLLRQLGLPLDVIRRVQKGELELDAALFMQQRTLEGRRAELAWAGRVCAAMREDGAQYSTLDAGKYLETLDRPAEGEGYFSLSGDSAPTAACPWRRFFARWLDLFLCRLFWTAFGLLVLRWAPTGGVLLALAGAYRDLVTMIFVEPVLLRTWGYTPGKWIFGLCLRRADGGKLTLWDGWCRTLLIFAKGMGFQIPFYGLWRLYRSYRACSEGELLPWEEGERYALRDARLRRWAGFGAAAATCAALGALVVLQAFMPRHRGALTAAEYVDNFNDLYGFLTQGPRAVLDEQGRWVGGDQQLGAGGGMDHTLTLDENGRVVEVSMTARVTGDTVIRSAIFEKEAAVSAFAAATGNYNCLSWPASGVLQHMQARPFGSYVLRAGDVNIVQKVTYQGYRDLEFGYLAPADSYLAAGNDGPDAARWYSLEFTMTLRSP